ncbi:MAG: CDP-alcohol phosphatidyltransferase family protein [Phycisphaerae bacterium]
MWLNWPNRITIARIALVGPFVICLLYLDSNVPVLRHAALFLFSVLALSDALDGILARILKQETPLGRFLDPVADKLLIVCAVIVLAGGSPGDTGTRLPVWVAVIAVGKDVLTVIGFGLVYATTGQFFIKPRLCGKLCTLVQLAMIAFVLLAPDLPVSFAHGLRPAWWLASGLAIIATVDYLRVGNRFAADYHAMYQRSTDDG